MSLNVQYCFLSREKLMVWALQKKIYTQAKYTNMDPLGWEKAISQNQLRQRACLLCRLGYLPGAGSSPRSPRSWMKLPGCAA